MSSSEYLAEKKKNKYIQTSNYTIFLSFKAVAYYKLKVFLKLRRMIWIADYYAVPPENASLITLQC